MDERNNSINLKEISEQLKAINTKINFLQDGFHEMKNELRLIKKSRMRGDRFSQLTKTADENFLKFLDNRPKDCDILDYCTTFVEKGILRVLRILLENGEDAAIAQIDEYNEISNSSAATSACPNAECLGNSTEIFNLLREIISNSRELTSRYTKELISLGNELDMEEVNEEQINNLLTPLSNVIRLKILKNLTNGGKYYTQLENLMGIKAGHLLFHIEKLKEADYVRQENKKYLITINGRKAFSLISILKKELILN